MKVEVAGLSFRIPLRWKITSLIALLLVLVMGGIKISAIDRMKRELTQELINSGRIVLASMIRPAGQIMTTDRFMETPEFDLDESALKSVLRDGVTKNEVVQYAYFFDKHGNVLNYTDRRETGDRNLVDFQLKVEGKPFKEDRVLKPYLLGESSSDVRIAEVVNQEVLDVEQPIKLFGGQIGVAKIGLSLARINSSVNEILREVFWLTLMIGVIGVAGALVMAHYLVVPIRLLVNGTLEMVKGHFNVRVPLKSHDELGDLTVAFNNMAEGLQQREKMKSAFGKMVSKDVYGDIMGDLDNVKIRGEKKHITILFSDIRGFTSHSEKMKPEEVTALLNEYFEEMVAIVLKYHGTLDKFIGDGLMALFGAPKSYGNDAIHACQAAIEMREMVKTLNAKWTAEGRTTIAIGVGLNTGDVTAGYIGSSKKMEYSVIGDAVNLSSRIEGLNKDFKTVTLISEFTYQEVKDHFETRELEAVKVKGKEQAVKIYELIVPKSVPVSPVHV